GRARAHEIGELVMPVADIRPSGTIYAVVPVGCARIVGQYPRRAGVHALGDNAEAGDEIVARKVAVAHDGVDLGAQPARVELCLHDRDVPAWLEREGSQSEIDVLDLRGAVPERQRAGND